MFKRSAEDYPSDETDLKNHAGVETRVILISYDGLITGSIELRADNKNSYSRLLALYGQQAPVAPPNMGPLAPGALPEPTDPPGAPARQRTLSLIGKYSVDYDNPNGPGKITEPHYDGFLVGISLLSNQVFDANFDYLRTDIADVDLPPNANPQPFYLSHLQTNVRLNGANQPAEVFTRDGLGADTYQTAHHIYLLGPASPSCFTKIAAFINANPGETIIIHVQGEANAVDEAHKTTTHTAPMMTRKDGMFPVAFNLWSGEREMRRIRALVTESYTVRVRDLLPAAVGAAAPNPIRAMLHQILSTRTPVTAAQAQGQKYIPLIYDDMLEFLENNVLSSMGTPFAQARHYDKFTRLRIRLICQDTYDKDNIPAIMFLLIFSTVQTNIDLISRRIYQPGVPGIMAPNVPVPPIQVWLDQVVALFGQGPQSKGFACSTNNQEWHGPVYSIGPRGAAPGLADVVRNGDFDAQATADVRRGIAALVKRNLEASIRGNYTVYATSVESTTDSEGAISNCGRAPFTQNLLDGVNPGYYWGISNPAAPGPDPRIPSNIRQWIVPAPAIAVLGGKTRRKKRNMRSKSKRRY